MPSARRFLSGNRAGSSNRFVLYAVVLAAVGVTLLVRWMSSREGLGVTWEEAPPETRGVWTTENSRYAGRAIEVAPGSVTLRLGSQNDAVVGSVEIARELFEDGDRIVRVEYATQQGPDALEMVIAENGTMHLFNQPSIIWNLDPNSAVPIDAPVVSAPGSSGPGLDPTILGALLVLALAGALVVLRVRDAGEGDVAPTDGRRGGAPEWLQGVWTTIDPKYQGHSVRIAPHYGYEQFGPGDVRLGGEITSIRYWREDGGRGVRLEYTAQDGSRDFEMVIDRAGHMRVKEGPRSVFVQREV